MKFDPGFITLRINARGALDFAPPPPNNALNTPPARSRATSSYPSFAYSALAPTSSARTCNHTSQPPISNTNASVARTNAPPTPRLLASLATHAFAKYAASLGTATSLFFSSARASAVTLTLTNPTTRSSSSDLATSAHSSPSRRVVAPIKYLSTNARGFASGVSANASTMSSTHARTSASRMRVTRTRADDDSNEKSSCNSTSSSRLVARCGSAHLARRTNARRAHRARGSADATRGDDGARCGAVNAIE
mmetsp:Transcript_7096/g.25945  ORF Transcript_7096/g.25945 Transcript_7096/m.25945 type:complete len:251 (-) Transcript_7096:14-766(-)